MFQYFGRNYRFVSRLRFPSHFPIPLITIS